MKKAKALVLLLAAPAAFAFEAVDTIPRATTFPAYVDQATPPAPTEVWLQGGMLRDNNLLRLETGAQSDTVMRLGAGIRHTTRVVGRQSLRLEARGDFYKFDRFSQLDHFAYGLLGEWLWEVGNQLSGTVGAARTRRLVDLGETQRAVRDMVTDTRAYATGAYRFAPDWRVRGALEHVRGDRTGRADAETRGNAVTAGIDYVTPLGNALGVEARRAHGDAPVPEVIAPAGTFVNNDFRETEVAAVASYSPGPTLRASGRLGRTHREYTVIPGRDFKGTTYRGSLDWLPSNKTLLNFSAYKLPRSIIDVAASHVLVKGVSFGPSWAATAKLVFSARLLRERREFQGDPTLALVPGTPLRDETIRALRLAAGWEPARHWEVGFGLDRGERESNIAGRDYDFTAVMANVAYRF